MAESKLYVVDRTEIHQVSFVVRAFTPDEAVQRVRDGEGDEVSEWEVYVSQSNDENAVEYDPEKHTLPNDFDLKKV